MESYSFIQNKTDIQNFFGNSTYMSLMEHLKELHPKEVQAYVLEELHIYGNSRIGMLKLGMNIVEMDESGEEMEIGFEAVPPTEYFGRNLGQKRYELSNHLGNTLVTVTDKKVYVDGSSGIEFEPEITTISDYYPYGAPIASRAYSIVEYRYGFNAQELENEISGDGNVLSATFWEFDTRLARRWNMDPVDKEFESPYACFAGNPVLFADPNGDDAVGDALATLAGGAAGYYIGGVISNEGSFNPSEWETFGSEEMIMGAFTGMIGGYALNKIGPDIAKFSKKVSGYKHTDKLITAAFTGVYNTMINYDKNNFRKGAIFGFFIVGAASGALSAVQTEGAAGKRAIIGATGLFNMANIMFYDDQPYKDGKENEDYVDAFKITRKMFLNGMIAAYAGQSLHGKMQPKKKIEGFKDIALYVGKKSLEYGLVNVATSLSNGNINFEGFRESFTYGFFNGAIQTGLSLTENLTLKLSASYISSMAEYYYTSLHVTYDDPELPDYKRSEKAQNSTRKKHGAIIFKTLMFNLVQPKSAY